MSFMLSIRLTLVFFIVYNTFAGLCIISVPNNDDNLTKLLKIGQIIRDYNVWKTKREQQYGKFKYDYPFGWPSFNCGIPTHDSSPVDVHHLSPWHISVIGAIGDSLTAGRAAGARNIQELQLDFRGLSFATGSRRDLSQQATLANILSYFSPNLKGYSIGSSSELNRFIAGFNLAKSGALSSDLLNQAKQLVNRIRSNPAVDFNNDWKYISVFIGSNDLCYACLNETKFGPIQYVENMREAIKYLGKNLPRSYVNIIPPFYIELLQKEQNENPFCLDVHRLSCPCLSKQSSEKITIMKKSFDEKLEIFSSEEYQTSDFAVSISYALNIPNLMTIQDSLNLAYIALDCFHFSEIAHDLVAKILWSDLFNRISTDYPIDLNEFQPERWFCPHHKCPYFKTVLNSANCTAQVYRRYPSLMRYQIDYDEAFRLPSMDVMQQRAFMEEYRFPLIFFSISLVTITVGLCVIIVSCKKRKDLTQHPNERTHLLDEDNSSKVLK